MRADRNAEKLAHKRLMNSVVVAVMLVVSIAFAGSAATLHSHHAGAQHIPDRARSGETPVSSDVKPRGGSGLRVEDPATGQMAPLPPAMEESVSTSDEGLVETPDAGGGTMITLGGRFRSYLTLRRDEAGQIIAVCSDGEKH